MLQWALCDYTPYTADNLGGADIEPMRRIVGIAAVLAAVAMLLGAVITAQERIERCAAVPLIAGDLLDAPDFANLAPTGSSGVLLPAGWSARAVGVQVGDFTVSGSGNSFQLLGIANQLRTPAVAIQPGTSYCITAQALADSISATRLQVTFHWLDAGGAIVRRDRSEWQDVRRWGGPNDRGGWSMIGGGALAPEGATQLEVTFQPASDDRVYLDIIRIRAGRFARVMLTPERPTQPAEVQLRPWPDGADAALSFSFDWETTMGGLVHSRSVDDPNFDQDPVLRGIRMREGVTTTLEIFRPYGIRATYYATGYNFLMGNRERRTFMGDPTFSWANRANRWQTDVWQRQPWFAPDPYGTSASDPAWYFGDLIDPLRREGQDIQSHTFSHLYGGLASSAEWRSDLAEWRTVAAEQGVAPARSLAFPWSGSAGMSFANWQELAAAGITSVTRTNWNPRQPQYHIVSVDEPHCRPVPGHERILACPDFYLTEHSAVAAPAMIDRALAVGGMIDLWAHTEEIVTPDQIAAWSAVVRYAAEQRDAGRLWIAPLAEIADRQQAVAQVELNIARQEPENGITERMPLRIRITNHSAIDLDRLTLDLPYAPDAVTLVNAVERARLAVNDTQLILDLAAGETIEVLVWPA